MRKVSGLFETRNSCDDKGSVPHLVKKFFDESEGRPVNIAPGIAARILEDINFPDQRRLKPARRQDHIDRIEHGGWNPELSEIAFAMTPDGRMWLVNGQHRLSAFVVCNRAVATRVHIVSCKDFQEVRRVYASYDQKESSRNTTELLDASGVADQTGLKRKIVRAVYNAVPIIANGMEPPASAKGSTGDRSHDARLSMIAEWEEEALAYQSIVDVAQSSVQRKLSRAGTAAVALYTLRHQPDIAAEFWRGTALNDGLRRYDPRSTLIDDMMARSLATGSARQAIQQPVMAWNAFYEGRSLKIIRCKEGVAITILGTPMAKRRR